MIKLRKTDSHPPRRAHRSWGLVFVLRTLLGAWVLASLLFAHGCHGNDDNELFGRVMEMIGK